VKHERAVFGTGDAIMLRGKKKPRDGGGAIQGEGHKKKEKSVGKRAEKIRYWTGYVQGIFNDMTRAHSKHMGQGTL